ncbi:MAG: alpha/beta fold hydrolase [Chloroflexota bacterium]
MSHSAEQVLKKIETYSGSNPKPDDHAEYWDAALAEMNAIDPQVEIVPADFQAPYANCSHLTFTGVGGERIHAKLLQPIEKPAEPRPAVLFFHGYTGSSGDWFKRLPYVAAGFTVAALDCRGQGGLSQELGGAIGNTLNGHIIRGLADALDGRPEKLLFRQIFLDTAQLAKIVMDMPDVDENRVGASGASQGGALVISCAALEPRIKLAAPIYPYLCDYLQVWEMGLAANGYGELIDWFRMFDPQHKQKAQVFENLGYIDVLHLAERVQAKTKWFVGLADDICPPTSQFAAYNLIPAGKSLELYPDFAHEDLPGSTDIAFDFMMGL